ncbi:MAG: HPr-rel-A system PqqD family peptide chaperone [Myxococcota bacterium]
MSDITRLRSLAISESGFLFDPVTGHTFNVNATGLAIVHALNNGKSEDEIVAILHDGFEQEGGEDVARDVEEFLARLREHGLVG